MMSLEATPRLWTRQEYHRMVEAGLLREDERVELIEGQILAMSPRDLLHDNGIEHTNELLIPLFKDTHRVRPQCAVIFGNYSEPEPDFALVPRSLSGPDHPDYADLIIEVANTSLAYDRKVKSGLYAAMGVPDYWILNVRDRQLEVHREPAPMKNRFGHGYTRTTIHGEDDTVSALCRPEIPIRVRDLL